MEQASQGSGRVLSLGEFKRHIDVSLRDTVNVEHGAAGLDLMVFSSIIESMILGDEVPCVSTPD